MKPEGIPTIMKLTAPHPRVCAALRIRGGEMSCSKLQENLGIVHLGQRYLGTKSGWRVQNERHLCMDLRWNFRYQKIWRVKLVGQREKSIQFTLAQRREPMP